jgi:transcriptional regulator with XRE-family HTH domain
VHQSLAKTIGEAARAARTARGLSQADAAEAVGISLEFYGRIERGGTLPSTPTLRSISEALGVSADALLGLGKRPLRDMRGSLTPDLNRLLRRLRRAKPRKVRLLATLAGMLRV